MKNSTICYIEKDGKTLMLHRNKKQNDIHEGKWVGLGGKMEQGETPEECIIREVKEESGLNIKSPKLKGILTFPKFKDNEDWYVFVFTASEFTGNIIDCDEGELKWIDNDEILNLNLWEGDKLFLKWMNEDKFFSGKLVYENGELLENKVVFYD
ncbi:NUDIX hydrolase [Tepidibacter formicigenes]|jgi:8-oxo-dGTP diphosphatase|uniref:8-oxo-dGTP diphosphatase n=1 Tax=Tepidibacter formicigenes DSM 15518 TaxID=1123349 RepID=A0A1M6KRI0_9FIRM|nr:8-oxo-dGTP diphosphatase [Tepidibacter formicigenes]SHJ61504.1 8-oxo-dGTP diphosphatase [Tepidibacter formicigenes DSM 15518]